MTTIRQYTEELGGSLSRLEVAYWAGREGAACASDADADWRDAWAQGRAECVRAVRPLKAFRGPNGWYAATENAEGFHHQPSDGGRWPSAAAALRQGLTGDGQ